MADVQPAEEFQRVLQSLVRVGLSLGGHIAAFGTFIWLGSETPLWLPALFALVITWYFATNEWTGQRPHPGWQLKLRSLVRALHAIGGGVGLALVFIYAPKVPSSQNGGSQFIPLFSPSILLKCGTHPRL